MRRMTDRLYAWWCARTVREKRLLAVMLALLAAVLFWLAVVRPVLDWRGQAAADRADAEAELAGVQTALRLVTPNAAARPVIDSEGFESLVLRTAEGAGLRISTPQLTVIGCAILLVGIVAWLVQRTRFGRALRAVAENPGVARLLGVPAQRVVSGTFLLSGVLAGAAGVLIGLHYSAVSPFVGADAGLKAIAVMVIGGVTRIWGVLLAGPLVGIAEVMTIYLGGSAVRDFVVYGLMIATLLLRPHGLLGKPPGQEGERL